MNHVAKRNQSGFTIIELMLAMGFISVLLLAIALTVIQVSTIYTRGLVVKEVNQVSRDIANDVRKTLMAASAIDATDGSGDYVTNSAGGRVCFGNYSYIWNTAKAIEGNTDPNLTRKGSGTNDPVVRFIKVADSSKIYCAKQTSGALSYPDLRSADVAGAKELIAPGDHSLGINRFVISTYPSATDTATGETLYTLKYSIGAGKTNAMNSNQTACIDQGAVGADFTYCSVQEFVLVLRAGNRV